MFKVPYSFHLKNTSFHMLGMLFYRFLASWTHTITPSRLSLLFFFARGVGTTTFLQTWLFFVRKLSICVSILCFLHLLPNIKCCGPQRHSKWRLTFVLSSCLDPIGDQSNVQHLLICVIIVLYGVNLVYLVFYLHTIYIYI